MLKFQKLSTVALMLASVLSANAFADTQTEAKPEAAKAEATEMKAADAKKLVHLMTKLLTRLVFCLVQIYKV